MGPLRGTGGLSIISAVISIVYATDAARLRMCSAADFGELSRIEPLSSVLWGGEG
jgi:hypothetical protein